MRILVGVFAAVLILFDASIVLACSPPVPGAGPPPVMMSLIPAKDVPVGAIQLRVARLEVEQIQFGRFTLPVLEVVDGEFAGGQIIINGTNIDDCGASVFDGLYEDSYVTVFPMLYSDGEPVRDDGGEAEHAAIFYRGLDNVFPWDGPLPKFADYAVENERFAFYDEKRIQCVLDGDASEDAWRRCVQPGEYVSLDCQRNDVGQLVCLEGDWPSGRPPELMRGYSIWTDWSKVLPLGAAAILALVLLGLVMRSRRRSTNG